MDRAHLAARPMRPLGGLSERTGQAAAWALRGIRTIVLGALLSAFLAEPADVLAAPERKAVLVLNSYHPGFAWTNAQVDGITAVLKESGQHPEIFLEHMDVLRLPAPYDERGLADHLGRRYRAQRFDLVVATDDAAVSFLIRHHASLFAGTPVVFSDAATFDARSVPPQMPITGVMERIDIPSTLAAAHRLRPRATRIVVYANRAESGSGFGHARDALAALKTKVPIQIHHDLRLEEIVADAGALSPEDIVFALASAQDAAGKWHSPAEVIARVSAASPAPLFDITSHRVRAGLTLGGKVEDGAEVGRSAARMAVRVLEGEDARRIPVQTAPVSYVFNYDRMQRHGIDEGELPEGSIVVGKPPSLYDQYRGTVAATAAVVLALSLAVVLLVNNIRRRKGAERELRASNALINAISRTQALYIAGADPRDVFERMLSSLLEMTGSEYGFIGEVFRDEAGAPYLRTQAITNIAWDDETRAFFATHAPKGLEFRNPQTLFGAVMTTEKPVIANDPANDPRRHGCPPGHPPLDAFMGLPFFRGDEMVGMVGVANRRSGYDPDMAARLEPFLNNCASLTEAVRENRKRRDAEAALRSNEERLRLALEAGDLGFYDLDLGTGEAVVSPEYAAMLGYAPGETAFNAANWLVRVHPDDRDEAGRTLRECVAGERAEYRLEYRLQTRSGDWKWIQSVGKVVARDAAGRPIRLLGTHADITARKLAEEALRRANEELDERVRQRTGELAASNAQLQQTLDTLRHAQEELIRSEKLASLGSLVAGVAHEMGTPLGNSLMVATTLSDKTREFSALAEGKGLSRTALKDYVAVATQATRLLERSLLQANDLIQHFKQVAVDQTSAQRRQFDLAPTIDEIVATLQPLFRKTPHRIRVDIPDDIVMDSFPGPLGQVITNLATNALVHGFAQVEAGALLIEAGVPENGRLTMTIRDDGCGIPSEHLPHIFDPFFTTRIGQGGSGLGLHIVYSIVTRVLGGRIEAHSAPGRGTTFVLDLPLRAPDAQATAATWSATPALR